MKVDGVGKSAGKNWDVCWSDFGLCGGSGNVQNHKPVHMMNTKRQAGKPLLHLRPHTFLCEIHVPFKSFQLMTNGFTEKLLSLQEC